MGKKPEGLVLRGNVYQIRIRVSEDVQPIIGKTEFTKSLRTRNYDEACERFWPLKAAFEKECADARRQLVPVEPVHLSEGMAEHFALAWFHETLNRVQQEAFTGLGEGDIAQQLADLDYEEAHLISGREEELLPGLFSLADKILVGNSYPVTPTQAGSGKRKRRTVQANVDKQSPGYRRLIELIQRGQLEAIRRERQVLLGRPVEAVDPAFAPLLNWKCSGPPDKGHILLSDLIEEYLTEERKSERAELDHRAAFRPMIEVIGNDTPIGELTPNHFHAVRNLIRRLPPNATKGKDRQNKTLAAIADDVERSEGETLSPVSVNKYLARITALMKWATGRWYIPRNPAEGLAVPTSDLPSAKDRRAPFSMSALKTIFANSIYTSPNASRPSMYWAPLISLFHGMRLEEILQLTVGDIMEVEGVKAIRIHDDGDNHLKRGATREVPIHPKMEEFEFSSLLAVAGTNPNGLLFSDARRGSEKKYGSAFSQRYTRHLIKIGVKTPITSFHSYRHNFRDAGRNCDLGDEITCAIGGWAYGSGAHTSYGSGYWMRKKAEAISKIAYPDVDFGKIKTISWSG